MTYLSKTLDEAKSKIFAIIGKLDNGSHSSNQLQGADEELMALFSSALNEQAREIINKIPDKYNGQYLIELKSQLTKEFIDDNK